MKKCLLKLQKCEDTFLFIPENVTFDSETCLYPYITLLGHFSALLGHLNNYEVLDLYVEFAGLLRFYSKDEIFFYYNGWT